MIVLASDHVGLGIVRFLLEGSYRVDAIVIHSEDRGAANDDIRGVAREFGAVGLVATEDRLQQPDYVESLVARAPKIGVLGWWPEIIRGRLLDLPEMGWVNLHPSFLPLNRGKNPNFWCLAQQTPCGVTVHFADRGIDTGPIIAQERIETTWLDTGETVYLKSRRLALSLFTANIDDVLAGRASPREQAPNSSTQHLSRELDEASMIDLDTPTTARQVLNIIRARTFPPHPGVRFQDQGKTYSVRVSIEEVPSDV